MHPPIRVVKKTAMGRLCELVALGWKTAFSPMAKFATDSHHRHFHPPAIRAAARLVDRVFGRRPHSTLPPSGHASHSNNEATPESHKRKTASVGQSTNTRFASPHTHRRTKSKGHPLAINRIATYIHSTRASGQFHLRLSLTRLPIRDETRSLTVPQIRHRACPNCGRKPMNPMV